jgi:hypothetical protein
MAYFKSRGVQPILQFHLKILQDKKTKFVATKALFFSLKMVQVCMKHKHTRDYLQNHIQDILFNIAPPLMLIT